MPYGPAGTASEQPSTHKDESELSSRDPTVFSSPKIGRIGDSVILIFDPNTIVLGLRSA